MNKLITITLVLASLLVVACAPAQVEEVDHSAHSEEEHKEHTEKAEETQEEPEAPQEATEEVEELTVEESELEEDISLDDLDLS